MKLLLSSTAALMFGLFAMPSARAATPECSEPPQEALRHGIDQNQAQRLIAAGRYTEAEAAFTCLLARDPASLPAYRGRAEARLMQGRYAAALSDHAAITAYVLPTQPDSFNALLQHYQWRLQRDPDDIALELTAPK